MDFARFAYRYTALPALALAWILASALATFGTLAAAASPVWAEKGEPAEPAAPRRHELLRMLRQDCGSCHGLRLTGGLGPALTPKALADKPVDSMTATIFRGRPGTPMPPWDRMLTEAEARWLADQLARGLPAEREVAR